MNLIDQEFSVRFRYPVHFTRGVFSPANHILRRVVADPSGHRPAELVAIVDDGVARAHTGLLEQFQQYVRDSQGAMVLAAPLLVVPGGETVKNEPAHLEAI